MPKTKLWPAWDLSCSSLFTATTEWRKAVQEESAPDEYSSSEGLEDETHQGRCIVSNNYSNNYNKVFCQYVLTWVNDHLWIATTWLQRPPFRGPILKFYNIKLPVNNDHCLNSGHKFGVSRVVVVHRFNFIF